ncbi:MAG: DUF4446 family protein [Candidatus Paceibacterota bacterium]|jgi:hypothetical protein
MITNMALYIIFGIVALGLVAWNISTERRLKKFFAGKKARDLEEIMTSLVHDLKREETSREAIEKHIVNMESRLKRSIQGIELVRFNPFKDAGSNQSFAIALMNEEGDGIVISSLYSRERMSVFAKKIKNNSPEQGLTDEEADVVSLASLK